MYNLSIPAVYLPRHFIFYVVSLFFTLQLSSIDNSISEISTSVLLASLKLRRPNIPTSQYFVVTQKFKVHKSVICPRSKFFSTCCKWGKNGAEKKEVTLEDDDPRLVKLMIDYFYQLEYDDATRLEKAEAEATSDGKEPDSPVQKNIDFYEKVASTQEVRDEVNVSIDFTPNNLVAE
ncbi:hypothetical protein LTR93_011835 [Exophiala xenobiotica]|nr:hypothetical protein LTR93_011835 [Exophiala xenobiotica]